MCDSSFTDARGRLPIVAVVCGLMLLAACRKSGDEEATRSISGYHAIDVQNGGVISGTVALSGAPPVVAPLEVNHDNDACGTTHPSPRLVCDAAGDVRNAVVYLEGIREGARLDVPSHPLEIRQERCAYLPHITIAPLGSTLSVQNLDKNVLHNVHMLLGDTTIWNQAQPMFEQINMHTVTRPGLMTLRCDAGHIWMSGYVWVTEHPYVALTDDSGRFVLRNVPPGTYTVKCWHEGWNAHANRSPQGELIGYAYDPPMEVSSQVVVPPSGEVTVKFVLNSSPLP